MGKKKIKLLILMAVTICMNIVPATIAHADDKVASEVKVEAIATKEANTNEEITVVNNEAKLAGEDVKAAEDEKIEVSDNWLTREVAKQLNKKWKDLTKDDFLKVVKIDLKYERIEDKIPEEISLLKNLEYLDLDYTRMDGDIPEALGDLPKLTHINLNENKFSSLPDNMIQKIKDGKYTYCSILDGNQIKLYNGWYLLEGKWYYYDRYGDKLTGKQKIDGVQYQFEDDGSIKRGWEKTDTASYYYDTTGIKVQASWKQIDNNWYYFNEEGEMLTGLQEIKGTKFYLASDGKMMTGIQEISGQKYCFAAAGGMQYGWVTLNNNRYYFDTTSGAMIVNTEMTIDGKKYKFGSDGAASEKNNSGWVNEYTYTFPNGRTTTVYPSTSHSNLNYQLFKYMTDTNNRISVDNRAVELHGGITSNNCVFFTSEALRRVGVSLSNGTCNTYDLENKLQALGFSASYDLSELRPGDIVFTNGYTHVYIFMGWDTDGYAYIVDNQSYNFDNMILHRRQIYNDTATTDRATHFYYYSY